MDAVSIVYLAGSSPESGVGAAMTYKSQEGGLEEQSPQGSENEEEESALREILSKKKVKT